MAPPPSFASIAQATAPRPACQDEHDLLLEQTRPIRGAQGELVARKQYVRIKHDVLQQTNHLLALVTEAPKTGSPLTVRVNAEGMSVESVARALEWQAATPRERSQLVQHLSWQYMSSLMHAASWLGSASLLTACEAKLCRQLRLENVSRYSIIAWCRFLVAQPVSLPPECNCACTHDPKQAVQLARAAERCSAIRLLTKAFFLLKAHFCAGEIERLRAHPRRPIFTTPSHCHPHPQKLHRRG